MRKCCGAGLADRRPALAIMLKIPRPGRVKTRLARDIGTVPAAWWMRHQTARVIRRLARDPRWRLVLAVTPDAEGSTELADATLKTLTDRMAAALGLERIRVNLYEVDVVNGLAAPDGRIFLTRGFYEKYRGRGLGRGTVQRHRP
jgi:hypothetical protein